MMELLNGYPPDVFAAVWHDALKGGPIANDRHDVRVLAKYARGAKPVTSVELAEDGMLGMGQWRDFGRIAIVTDEAWVRHAVQFLAPFFHGPTRVFANAQFEDARVWVEQHDHH